MSAIGLIYCGAVLFVNAVMLLGQVTTTVPAYFILTGHYDPTATIASLAAVGYAVLFAAAFTLGRRDAVAPAAAETAQRPEQVAA